MGLETPALRQYYFPSLLTFLPSPPFASLPFPPPFPPLSFLPHFFRERHDLQKRGEVLMRVRRKTNTKEYKGTETAIDSRVPAKAV